MSCHPSEARQVGTGTKPNPPKKKIATTVVQKKKKKHPEFILPIIYKRKEEILNSDSK